jgi:hypothetical protein
MEKRDYLLREIEKIGMMLAMIINRIAGNKDNYAISMENQFEAEREMLLNEAGFDIRLFISLQKAEIEPYLARFDGIKGANFELLADLMKEIGMLAEPAMKMEYLEKSLNLYELSTAIDKSFSLDREEKIQEIKKELSL